jgi:hypothetical protein
MFVDFLLIKIAFLAIVLLVPSIAMVSPTYQIGIFKREHRV